MVLQLKHISRGPQIKNTCDHLRVHISATRSDILAVRNMQAYNGVRAMRELCRVIGIPIRRPASGTSRCRPFAIAGRALTREGELILTSMEGMGGDGVASADDRTTRVDSSHRISHFREECSIDQLQKRKRYGQLQVLSALKHSADMRRKPVIALGDGLTLSWGYLIAIALGAACPLRAWRVACFEERVSC